MSTESTVAFYGVRFQVRHEEITSLEERSHPLLIAAPKRLEDLLGQLFA